ncbi:hypothetical protein JIG36_35240 [Actinoplanes sp. LDG1-06]|uniref:WXG100 family type VII secretion target n=1 Tax=Paractinoplanes ovalisporus TaxID=2810368 RepID=A0ABS2AN08_9ACTN|nr:hypothetical protein [Actinoplanes ovalisporus]MBM2620768.1 hypothetical protein [Actinoplanes ovalisporus]
MSEGEFREKLADLDRMMKEVSSTVETLFNRCNRAMRFMPPGISHGMAASLGKLNDLIADFFEEMAKILLNPGWPFGLMAAGDEWTSKVGGPLSELSNKLGPDQMKIDNYWTGRAAEAYGNVIPAQQKALDSIKTITDSIDSNLTKTAVGIFAMWAGVILAVVSYVAELIAEAGAAATVVGAPPAAAGAGVSTAKVIGLVVACVALFVTFVGTIVDSVTSLNQTLHNGGTWPQATTSEFNDGSLSDGDTTDWRYKTDD